MIKYKIIFKDNNYLVINKPAGLLVHGAKHIKELTLIDQLLKECPLLAKIGEDPARPGIVHRLDRRVSGLMVVPKTQTAFDDLKKQFKKRIIKKKYTALVYGQIEKQADEINFPVRRSSKGFKMAALPLTARGKINKAGKQAITEFTVNKKFINYTLLKVRIKTGRTHQIRVHLLAYGHPVVGDDLYSTKKTRTKNARLYKQGKLDSARIFLVADELSFMDLGGKKQAFKIDLPNDLKNLLKQIK